MERLVKLATTRSSNAAEEVAEDEPVRIAVRAPSRDLAVCSCASLTGQGAWWFFLGNFVDSPLGFQALQQQTTAHSDCSTLPAAVAAQELCL